MRIRLSLAWLKPSDAAICAAGGGASLRAAAASETWVGWVVAGAIEGRGTAAFGVTGGAPGIAGSVAGAGAAELAFTPAAVVGGDASSSSGGSDAVGTSAVEGRDHTRIAKRTRFEIRLDMGR